MCAIDVACIHNEAGRMKEWVSRLGMWCLVALCLVVLPCVWADDSPLLTAPPLPPGIRAVLTDQKAVLTLVGWYGLKVEGSTHTYNTGWDGTRVKVTIEPLHGMSETTGEYCQGETLITFQDHVSGFNGVYCDMNGDGVVDMLDMHELLKHMDGPAEAE